MLKPILVAAILAAQPSALGQFETSVIPATQNLALAHAANMCGLRSGRWLRAFDEGFSFFVGIEAERLHVSDADRDAADVTVKRVYSSTIAGAECRKLVNSPVMDHLDRIQDTLTAGFH